MQVTIKNMLKYYLKSFKKQQSRWICSKKYFRMSFEHLSLSDAIWWGNAQSNMHDFLLVFTFFCNKWRLLKNGFLIFEGLKQDYIVLLRQPYSGQKSVRVENASLSKLSRFVHLFGCHFETKQRIGSNRIALERPNQVLFYTEISNLYLTWCKFNSSLKKFGSFWSFFVKNGSKGSKRVKICFFHANRLQLTRWLWFLHKIRHRKKGSHKLACS